MLVGCSTRSFPFEACNPQAVDPVVVHSISQILHLQEYDIQTDWLYVQHGLWTDEAKAPLRREDPQATNTS